MAVDMAQHALTLQPSRMFLYLFMISAFSFLRFFAASLAMVWGVSRR